MTPEEIEKIEISNSIAKKAIAKGEALKRLLVSDDYKLVISEGYFQELPKEIAVAIANNTGAYDTDSLVEMLKHINGLKGYEFQVANNMDAAQQDLEANAELIASQTETVEGE